ncbi:MAG: hypothetical protein NTY30_01800 [Candidatus Berkelbacteria bacterium]|nr:hypothetical protein [Candidatus Berkelbacteria bacterium]
MPEEMELGKKNGGKNIWIILIIVVIAAAIIGDWYFFLKKSAEGGSCSSDRRCETNLKCISKTCSSGARGSACSDQADCKTSYCVNSKCTEGKVNDACITYKDCADGLYCKIGTCIIPPDYSKYFTKVVISKIKPGSGPGPSNPETVTTNFVQTDALEMDFIGVKSTTIGEFYYQIINSSSGEISRSSKNEQQLSFSGRDIGSGTSLDNVSPGIYDLNIYFKDDLVFIIQITVS